MTTIEVPQETLRKIVKSGNLELFYNDEAKAYEYEGERYVYTGSVGAGDGTGYRLVDTYKAVKQKDYTGALEPLMYDDYMHEVAIGRRERGYLARLVFIDYEAYVLSENVEFILKSNNQTK